MPESFRPETKAGQSAMAMGPTVGACAVEGGVVGACEAEAGVVEAGVVEAGVGRADAAEAAAAGAGVTSGARVELASSPVAVGSEVDAGCAGARAAADTLFASASGTDLAVLMAATEPGRADAEL